MLFFDILLLRSSCRFLKQRPKFSKITEQPYFLGRNMHLEKNKKRDSDDEDEDDEEGEVNDESDEKKKDPVYKVDVDQLLILHSVP